MKELNQSFWMAKHPQLSLLRQACLKAPYWALYLFLLYINDSATMQLHSGTCITMYADDLLLYREISCHEDYLKLQQDVNTIADWVDVNKLTLEM